MQLAQLRYRERTRAKQTDLQQQAQQLREKDRDMQNLKVYPPPPPPPALPAQIPTFLNTATPSIPTPPIATTYSCGASQIFITFRAKLLRLSAAGKIG